MTPNTQQDQTPKLKIKLGLQLSNHSQKTNDRQGFNIGVESISTGVRSHLQQDRPLHELGGLFINE